MDNSQNREILSLFRELAKIAKIYCWVPNQIGPDGFI